MDVLKGEAPFLTFYAEFEEATARFMATGRDHLIAKMEYDRLKSMVENDLRKRLKDGECMQIGTTVFVRLGDSIHTATLTNI